VTAIATDRPVDLRRDPLSALRAIDFRSPRRDYWADEAAIHDRLAAVWAGLDDAAWRLPGAAPSDAGGPDWSLLDHVAHIVDWWELAAGYIGDVQRGAAWPSDDVYYEGGDFNALNERRRALFADVAPADLRARGAAAHDRVVSIARGLEPATIRSDEAWGWVHQVLHGHALDHLTVLEPWADALRERQIRNDPFGPDPQPARSDLATGVLGFWAAARPILFELGRAMAETDDDAWTRPNGGDWTFADHVAHLAGWFELGAEALEDHRAGRGWRELPPEGIDAFNDRQVRAARGTPPTELRRRFAAGRTHLEAAIEAMTDDEWLDPEGFSWAYEDLHGHVRAHHAMIGPWVARVGWPPAPGSGPDPEPAAARDGAAATTGAGRAR
jgi:hypothetical protein